jgi:Secretory lipase
VRGENGVLPSPKFGLAAAVLVAIVSGLLLIACSPPTSLVDAPMYDMSSDTAGDLDTPVTPELSPFYEMTGWAPTGRPGALIRAEPVSEAPNDVRMWRIIYESTDLAGRPIPVSALFATPAARPPQEGFPLIGFAHGTTGVGEMCGISHTPLEVGTPGYSAWVPHLEPMVRQGWAVVASDYSGMGAPGPQSYLVGPLEARGILDSMRAVIAPNPATGAVPIDTARLGVYGKSQGGEAALSALQLAPHYAPDLDIAGGVILAPGFTPSLQGVLDAVASNPTSTAQNMFVLLIAQSYARNYPELVSLDDIVSPEGQKRIDLLARHCGTDLADRVSDVPLSDLIKTPFAPGLVSALARGMPGTEKLEMPIVVVQGLKDVTILPQFTHAEVMSQCALGTTTFYVRYPEDDHPSINFQAREHQPSVIDWMNARWAGEPAPSNCPNQLLGQLSWAAGVNS